MDYRGSFIKASVLLILIAVCITAIFSLPGRFSSEEHLLSLTCGRSVGTFTSLVIGFAIGCYGTIVGIGGGPIIIPVLISLYGWDTEALVGTCLLIVFLNALSGSIGYAMQGRIDVAGGLKFSLAAIPGAVLIGLLHCNVVVEARVFDIIFGVFLLLLALYCCLTIDDIPDAGGGLSKPAGPGFRRVRFTDSSHNPFDFYVNDSLGIKINLVLGVFSGFLGIGGGIVQVPVLLYLLYYPPHIATATSHFVTMITAFAALIPHLILGHVHIGKAMVLGLGVIVGAQVGAQFAAKLSSKTVVCLFIVILLIFAARLLSSG